MWGQSEVQIPRLTDLERRGGVANGTVKFSGRVADLADEKRHAELPWIIGAGLDPHKPRHPGVLEFR